MEIPTPVMYFIQVKTRKYTALKKLRQNLGKFVKPELLVYLRLQIGYLHLIASPTFCLILVMAQKFSKKTTAAAPKGGKKYEIYAVPSGGYVSVTYSEVGFSSRH